MSKPFWLRVCKEICWDYLEPNEAYLVTVTGDKGNPNGRPSGYIPFARIVSDAGAYKINASNWLTPEDRHLGRSFKDRSFPAIEEAKKALQDVFCTLDFSKIEVGSKT